MRKVFIINNQQIIEEMPAIHCNDECRELQDLLQNNFELLAGDQIDPINPRQWILIKREMPITDPSTGSPRWSIDFLFADQSGIPTFVECKRYKDTRSRREVIGQMMEYAANAQYYWDKDDLIKYATDTANKAGQTLEDSLGILIPDEPDNIESYFDSVYNSLKTGQIRLIFFLEESPSELKSIVDFLNNQMERSEVLIVEARQYSKGSMKIVIPTLFGFSEQARQIKKRTTTTTGGTSKNGKQKIWTRNDIEDQIINMPSKTAASRYRDILNLSDTNPELIRIYFGTGQTASIIFRNDQSRALMYFYLNGIVQTPAPHYIRKNFGILQHLEEKYATHLSWRTPFQQGKFSSLNSKLQDLKEDQFIKLKEFILDLARELHGAQE